MPFKQPAIFGKAFEDAGCCALPAADMPSELRRRNLAVCIGDDFAQVVVVGVLQLVLDDHLSPGAGFLRVDVDAERVYGRFGLDEFELDANLTAKEREVGFP